MTKDEAKYLSQVAAMGCIICERNGYEGTPAEVHHIRTGTGAGKRASHYSTIPLCPYHHRGNEGLHGMGRKAFESHFGITELDLVAIVRTRIQGVM